MRDWKIGITRTGFAVLEDRRLHEGAAETSCVPESKLGIKILEAYFTWIPSPTTPNVQVVFALPRSARRFFLPLLKLGIKIRTET